MEYAIVQGMTNKGENKMIDEIFENHKPILEQKFKDNVYRTFNNIVEDLGPELKGVYNDWTWAKVFSNVVKPVYLNGSINEERLNAFAKNYAYNTVENWKAKINEKLGDLDNGEVHNLNDTSFSITGTKEDHKVYIEQQMIVNISSKGTLFNQFPARMYLDGKAISAKKFKTFFEKK